MKIRAEQMTAFSEAAVQNFEERMHEHLKRFFPRDSKRLGERRVREEIQYGLKRAQSYGFVSERDICKFIDVMFAYGHKFDQRRRRYPWAQQVLTDRSISDPAMRANRLVEAALRSPHRALPFFWKWRR